MKKKYSAQQREELLLECKNSGLSAAEWCKQNDIPYQTLAYWRQTIKAGQTKDPFVEIFDKPTIQHNHLEVRYANAVIRLNLSSEGALSDRHLWQCQSIFVSRCGRFAKRT